MISPIKAYHNPILFIRYYLIGCDMLVPWRVFSTRTRLVVPGFLQLSAGADAIVQKIMSLPFTKVRACRSWHHRNFAMVEIYRWKIVHFRMFYGDQGHVMKHNYTKKHSLFWGGHFPLRWWRYVDWKPDFDAWVFKDMRVKNQSTTWMLGCSVGSAGKRLGSVGSQYTPFTSRWNNPLILTSDPYFQRDIQVWVFKPQWSVKIRGF